jgi:hypothetical protein
VSLLVVGGITLVVLANVLAMALAKAAAAGDRQAIVDWDDEDWFDEEIVAYRANRTHDAGLVR